MTACAFHPTHLKRGSTNYGWDPETDRWDQCAPTPIRRKAPVAVVTQAEPERDPFLSVAEVARRLDVSKMTVYRLVHAAELRAVQVGRSYRVRQSAFAEYIKSAEVGAS